MNRILLFPLLLLAACAGQNAANAGNFGAAVTRYLEQNPEEARACASSRIPRELFSGLETGQFEALRGSSDLDYLRDLGYIEYRPTSIGFIFTVPGMYAATTEKWREDFGRDGRSRVVCFGEHQLASVDDFTQPSESGGMHRATAEVTLRTVPTAAWLSDERLSSVLALEPWEETKPAIFPLVLKDSGWQVAPPSSPWE